MNSRPARALRDIPSEGQAKSELEENQEVPVPLIPES